MMSDDPQLHSDPACRIVDMKTGDLIMVYKNIDGSVIGWNRRREGE